MLLGRETPKERFEPPCSGARKVSRTMHRGQSTRKRLTLTRKLRVRKLCSRTLPPGVYAVSVFHDENMNQKLDKNFVGVPKEGYGDSNNPKKKMGPPSFEETKFQLSATEQSTEIKLMY